MDAKALQAELEKVRRDLAKVQQSREDLKALFKNVSQIDKDVVKRWLAVTLLTKGCPAYEPRLYVRWEGTVVDATTGKSIVDPATGKIKDTLDPFDASAPRMHALVGNGMLFLGPTVGPSALTEWFREWIGTAPTPLLDRTGVAVTSFFAVSKGPGDRSIYIGLSDPRSLRGGECIVRPIIHGSSGRAVDGEFKLSLAQPFAWIRRVRLTNEGNIISRAPKYDTEFQGELETFSAKQSQKLCENKLICGTQDAHWAMYAKPPPPPPEALEWRQAYRFTSDDDRYDIKSPMTVTECAKACVDDPRCAAVEHDDDRKTCSLYDARPLVRGAPGPRWKVGTRASSPLQWRIDRAVEGGSAYRSLAGTPQDECAKACLEDGSCKAVEYYKPTRHCHMFASIPKIVPSPIAPYGPTDVGVPSRR
jgi:hypothetical protein